MSAVQPLPRFLLPRLTWSQQLPTSRHYLELQQHRHRALRRTVPTAIPSQRYYSQAPASRQRQAPGPARQQRPSLAITPLLASQNASFCRRRDFHATAARQRDHHFDTLKFVQRLRDEGFTEEQSAAMMKVLNDVIEER